MSHTVDPTEHATRKQGMVVLATIHHPVPVISLLALCDSIAETWRLDPDDLLALPLPAGAGVMKIVVPGEKLR